MRGPITRLKNIRTVASPRMVSAYSSNQTVRAWALASVGISDGAVRAFSR